MASTRAALVVAAHEFEDPRFQRLRSPARDVDALAEVLADPEIGGFSVQSVVNQPNGVVQRELETFFSTRKPEDLLLVYFSCHGVKDSTGRLYFATTNTAFDLLRSTGVPASFVSEQMELTRSKRIVVLLDCCYSGAFLQGFRARGDDSVSVSQLEGRGRAVITASRSTEYAFEADELTSANAQPSVFTGAVVEGLATGAADRNGDGIVTVDELYDFVYDNVRGKVAGQTPGRWVNLEGELAVARNPRPPVRAAELPAEVLRAVESDVALQRLGAVWQLGEWLDRGQPGEQMTAREVLDQLTRDYDERVRKAAATALSAPPATPTPTRAPAPTPAPTRAAPAPTPKPSSIATPAPAPGQAAAPVVTPTRVPAPGPATTDTPATAPRDTPAPGTTPAPPPAPEPTSTAKRPPGPATTDTPAGTPGPTPAPAPAPEPTSTAKRPPGPATTDTPATTPGATPTPAPAPEPTSTDTRPHGPATTDTPATERGHSPAPGATPGPAPAPRPTATERELTPMAKATGGGPGPARVRMETEEPTGGPPGDRRLRRIGWLAIAGVVLSIVAGFVPFATKGDGMSLRLVESGWYQIWLLGVGGLAVCAAFVLLGQGLARGPGIALVLGIAPAAVASGFDLSYRFAKFYKYDDGVVVGPGYVLAMAGCIALVVAAVLAATRAREYLTLTPTPEPRSAARTAIAAVIAVSAALGLGQLAVTDYSLGDSLDLAPSLLGKFVLWPLLFTTVGCVLSHWLGDHGVRGRRRVVGTVVLYALVVWFFLAAADPYSGLDALILAWYASLVIGAAVVPVVATSVLPRRLGALLLVAWTVGMFAEGGQGIWDGDDTVARVVFSLSLVGAIALAGRLWFSLAGDGPQHVEAGGPAGR